MVAEQALGGLVQGQDAAGQIERDGAVGRPVEHRLKVARRTAARRRLALGGAQSRPQLRFERAAQRDQRRRRAVPADHLRVAVDGQDLPVRPHDRDRAHVFGRHRLRIAVAEHPGERVRRLKFCEIAIADEIEQRPVGVERAPVAGDEDADRQPVKHGAGVAPNLDRRRRRGPAKLAFPIRLLLGASVDPAFPTTSAPARSSEWSSREAGARPTRARAISRNASRSLRLSSTLSAGKLSAVSRASASSAPGRIGTILDETAGRRMAQDVNLGGALRRRLSLARRGALGEIRLRSLRIRRIERRPPARSAASDASVGARSRSGSIGSAAASRFGRSFVWPEARLRARTLRTGGAADWLSIRLERNLERRRGVESIGRREFEIRFDRPCGGFAAPGARNVRGAPVRASAAARLGQSPPVSAPVGRRPAAPVETVALGRSGDGLDLLAQHAKAAVAQKFAMAAEHRRSRKRDHPAPSRAPESGHSTVSPEKVCRSPSTRASSSPPSNPARRTRASTDSPRRGALAPTAATSAGCDAPNRPSSSRVHRKREFGVGASPRSRSAESSSVRRASASRTFAIPAAQAARHSPRPEPEPTPKASSRLPARRCGRSAN